MANINLVLPDELLAAIDGERGDVPRVRWIRRAVEQALSEAKEPLSREQADPGLRTPGEGRSAAPAERPFKMGRVDQGRDLHGPAEEPSSEPPLSRADLFRRAGSAEAKRDVRPVPKKGER